MIDKTMLKTVKGNLLDMFDNLEFDIIAHGCNCHNTMGAGIARQIAERYPAAFLTDQSTISGDIQKLGNWTSVSIARTPEHISQRGVIFNFYTQFYPGKHFDPVAFRLILRKFRHYIRQTNETFKIGFPIIGCGIGGGSRDEVERIIRHELWDLNVTLVEWPGDSWKENTAGERINEEPIVDHIEKEN